ncbi:MAG: hypothetical protein JW705_07895 [Methanosarcinaceae archaeon]|nr:hypothetical protein [Methanosarcinaceae archaeon]
MSGPYCVIFDEKKVDKKFIELSRYDLDENYYRLFRHIIYYLRDNKYEVNGGTDIENKKLWGKKQSFEISFRLKRKAGLFGNKTEYGDTHTLWIGYTGNRAVIREVGVKIDGRPYAPGPALKEIYNIVRNRK